MLGYNLRAAAPLEDERASRLPRHAADLQ